MDDDWETAVRSKFDHRHKQTFNPDSDTDSWLREMRGLAEKHQFNFYAERTSSGFEIGFPTEKDFHLFTIFSQNDLQGDRNCEAHFTVDCSNPHQWAQAGSLLLQSLGIVHDCRVEGAMAIFRFDRMSEKLLFEQMNESRMIAQMCEAMDFRDYINRELKHKPNQGNGSTDPALP